MRTPLSSQKEPKFSQMTWAPSQPRASRRPLYSGALSEPEPFVSLVIPAYNEEKLLPRLLESVERARRAYQRGRGAVEVVVADNLSTDTTAAIASSFGCRLASVEPHVIGAVRNGGAAIARGEILCFIDADSRIDEQTFNEIEKILAKPCVVAGTTGIRFERWSLGLVVTFAILWPFMALLRLDTGVVFCRRKDFEEIGGYDESMKFAEDLRFLWDMRRLGKTRGQRLVRLAKAKAFTSTRKFDRWGQWHFLIFPFRFAWSRLRGSSSFDRLAEKYWYSGER
jgi:hypothetical protein